MINISYGLHSVEDANFLRTFTIELVEKALKKIENPGPEEKILMDEIEMIKQNIV